MHDLEQTQGAGTTGGRSVGGGGADQTQPNQPIGNLCVCPGGSENQASGMTSQASSALIPLMVKSNSFCPRRHPFPPASAEKVGNSADPLKWIDEDPASTRGNSIRSPKDKYGLPRRAAGPDTSSGAPRPR